MPNCTLSVSPCTIETLSNGIPSRSDTNCAKVVSWPWPCAWQPVSTSTLPVGLTRTSADSHKPTPRAERADRLARCDAASLDVGRIAKPAQLAVTRRLAFAFVEAFDIGELQRLFERGVIVARVVSHNDRRLMRKRFDEIAFPQIGGIDLHLPRRHLDQPLDHEGRFRTSCATISIDRRGIGVDGIHLAIDVRNVVLAR